MSTQPLAVQTPVTISHAHPSDYPSLAAILPLANAANPVERFMFRHDARENPTPPSHRWALRQFQEGQRSHEVPGGPTTHILKAVVDASGENVGFAIIRIFQGGNAKGEEVGRAEGVVTDVDAGEEQEAVYDELDHDFCRVWIVRMNEVYEQEMSGKEHAFWSALMVLPAYQNLGIGSAIVRWALSNLHLDSLPTWLNAQPDGYNLYKKFGWRDVEAVDVDLSKWAGPNKGYGVHRTVCMLRDPYGGTARSWMASRHGQTNTSVVSPIGSGPGPSG